MDKKSELKELLYGFALSWFFSVTLGCVLIVGVASREPDFRVGSTDMFKEIFLIMYPIGLAVSTFAAIVATPFAALALRTGTKNLIIYGSVFWVLLALYIFWAPSFSHDGLAIVIGAFLTVIGLLVIGRIPPIEKK